MTAAPTKLDEILSWRAAVLPTRLGEFIKVVKDAYPDTFSTSLWHAGIADGRLRMMEPLGADASEHSRRLTHLRNIAESCGGSLVIESAPDEIKLAIDAWGRRGRSEGVMKRIKDELDPQNLLSPGRF